MEAQGHHPVQRKGYQVKKTRAIHTLVNLWSGVEYTTKQRRWRSTAYKARRAMRRGKTRRAAK